MDFLQLQLERECQIGWMRSLRAWCSGRQIVTILGFNTVLAQDVPATELSCANLEQEKAFEERPASPPRIVAKFFEMPGTSADPQQLRKHVLYSNILGRLLSARPFDGCLFLYRTDASPTLSFEVSRANNDARDTCLVRRCAHVMSKLLDSATISEQEFSDVIHAFVQTIRRSDPIDIKTPIIGALYAASKAFPRIYPAGTLEHIVHDLSAEDYQSANFHDFNIWLGKNQTTLRNVWEGKDTQARRPSSAAPSQERSCLMVPDLRVQGIDIDHHGWGHQSIIMINYAAELLDHRIKNITFRAFCPPHDGKTQLLAKEPWREMSERIACIFTGHNETDRWLILSSKQAPPITNADMKRYAQSIVDVLNEDRCRQPEYLVFVARFLRER